MSRIIGTSNINNWYPITCLVGFTLFGLSHAVTNDVDELIFNKETGKLGCPADWHIDTQTNVCYLIDLKQVYNWTDATDICDAQGAVLATFEDTASMPFILDYTHKYIPAHDLLWIGLKWNINTGTFQWSSGNNISEPYPYWTKFYPFTQSFSRCVGIVPWVPNDNTPMKNQHCSFVGGYVCMKAASTVLPIIEEKCDQNFHRYRNTSDCYRLTTGMYDWDKGLAVCRNAYSADMARIEGNDLELFIKDTVMSHISTAWLNFKFNSSVENFVWMDDFSVVNHAIYGDQHNDRSCGFVLTSFGDPQWYVGDCDAAHYTMCQKSTRKEPDYSHYKNIDLVDTVTITIQKQVASGCPSDEWVFNHVTKTCYKLFDEFVEWRKAVTLCKSVNARLLMMKDSDGGWNYNNKLNITSEVWIGMKYRQGKYIWNDGTPVSDGTVSTLDDNVTDEVCVSVGNSYTDFWARDCLQQHRFICEYRHLVTESLMFMVVIEGHQYFLANESHLLNASQTGAACTSNFLTPLIISTVEELTAIITWLTNNQHALMHTYWAVLPSNPSSRLSDEWAAQLALVENEPKDTWYTDKMNDTEECGDFNQCCFIFGLNSKPIQKYYLLRYPCGEAIGFMCEGPLDLPDSSSFWQTTSPQTASSNSLPTTTVGIQSDQTATLMITPTPSSDIFTAINLSDDVLSITPTPTIAPPTATITSNDLSSSSSISHISPITTRASTLQLSTSLWTQQITIPSASVSSPLTQEERQDLVTSINHLTHLTKPPTSCTTRGVSNKPANCNTSATAVQKAPNKMCPCACGAPKFNPNPSPIELNNILAKIRKVLDVPKTNLATTKSKKQSATDNRPSSQTMGGMVLFVTSLPVLVVMVTDMWKLCQAILLKLCNNSVHYDRSDC